MAEKQTTEKSERKANVATISTAVANTVDVAPSGIIAPLNLPRIVCREGVCGGVPCIRGTRLPVWAIQLRRQKGRNIDDMLEAFPFLAKEDVLAAIDYADAHQEEIERQIRENDDI